MAPTIDYSNITPSINNYRDMSVTAPTVNYSNATSTLIDIQSAAPTINYSNITPSINNYKDILVTAPTTNYRYATLFANTYRETQNIAPALDSNNATLSTPNIGHGPYYRFNNADKSTNHFDYSRDNQKDPIRGDLPFLA